jgi:TolB-like protein
MKTNSIKTVMFLAMFAGAAFAQVKNVAVIETELDAQSGVAKDLTKAEVREITTELRRQAVRNLPKDKYNVMTEATVQAQGAAVLQDCFEENCMITLGGKIGADYIVRGTISKFQKRFTLSVEIYDTEDGNLIISSDPVRSEKIEDLLDESADVCVKMYKDFIGMRSSASAKLAEKKKRPDIEKKSRFGIIGAVGSTSLGGDDSDESLSGLALMAGMGFIKPITLGSIDLEIETGLLLSWWKFTHESSYSSTEFTVMGMDIPLLLRYDFGGPYVGAGLKIGIPISAESVSKYYYDYEYEFIEDNIDYSDGLTMEISFAISAGFQFERFYVGLKYFLPINSFVNYKYVHEDDTDIFIFNRSGFFIEAGFFF